MTIATVVVPYRPGDPHRDRLWAWVYQWWRTWFPEYHIITADSDARHEDTFNRGGARNRAVRAAQTDVIIIADADTIPYPSAVDTAVECVGNEIAPWIIPYSEGSYYNLTEKATLRRLKFPANIHAPITEPWDEDDWEHKITSWAGCLVVRRADYWRAGGYPEFEEWGYEDDCFRTALDFVAGRHQRLAGFALHLWHPVTEAQRFGNPDIEANRSIFMQYKRARTHQQMAAVIAEHGHRG